jgi:lysozyme
MSLVGDFNICEDAIGVVIEMVFQLGIGGVSKFKNMLEALKESDYAHAAVHMLASNWHKQTPTRCEELAEILRTCADIN